MGNRVGSQELPRLISISEYNGVRIQKSLPFIGAERKSRKNVHLDRRQETQWEISNKMKPLPEFP
jgi:hypothetical protein